MILGCTGGDGDDIPCTPFPEWHPPQTSVQESVDATTLVCTHAERLSTCPETDGCCYSEHDTITAGVVDCSTIKPCGTYDETACLADSRCFVARNDVTNAFIGCYLAYPYNHTTRHCSDRDAADCISGTCVAVYAQPTDSPPMFVRCTD